MLSCAAGCVQIDCGDKYENEVVQKFNKCALSVNGCVPRRIDSVMEWPVGGLLVSLEEDTPSHQSHI